MKTVKYNWKKFPDKKPQKSGRYTVTTSHTFMGKDFRTVYQDIEWSAVHQKWNCRDDAEEDINYAFDDVIAWAEADYIPYTGDVAEGCEVVA